MFTELARPISTLVNVEMSSERWGHHGARLEDKVDCNISKHHLTRFMSTLIWKQLERKGHMLMTSRPLLVVMSDVKIMVDSRCMGDVKASCLWWPNADDSYIYLHKRCFNVIAKPMGLSVGSEMPRLAFVLDSVVCQIAAGACIVFMALSTISQIGRKLFCSI